MAPKRKSDELELPDLKPNIKQEIKQEAKADARDGKIYHYVEQELMPNSVALDPNFIKLSDKVDGICRRFQEVLKDPRSENRSIKMFADGVTSDILKRKVDSTTMSLTGPMGSGKSETINTILHETIAPTGKSGSSVTLVPHKYCGPTANQKKRFLAKITFFVKKQRLNFFETELAAYYRAKNASDSGNGEDDGGDQDAEDVDVCDTVVDALYFLFMAREECKSRNAVREFLKSAESEKDQRLLNRLGTWADSAVAKSVCAAENNYAIIEADTAETLLAKLAAYTSEATEDDGIPVPSLWPLVSSVSIHFDNPLSKLGVSLLDVPGSSDNHIRRGIAQKFARLASHTAIIAPASRANSGNSISKEAKVAKGKGDGRIMVIITCSDEIDDETVVGGTLMQRQQVKRLRSDMVGLNKQLNATRLEQTNAAGDEDGFRLYRQELQQNRQLKEKRDQETALRIAMRGENTRETIQRKLADVTNFVNPIPVFWLSNLPYRKHRAGYLPNDAPSLTVEETNGPAIRRTISEFPNASRMRQMEHIYNSQLPMLFSRVRLFSTRAPADLKADIEGFVDSPLNRYPDLLGKIMTKIKSATNDCILTPIRDEESNWIPKAEKLCDRWADEFAKPSELLWLMNRGGRRRGTTKRREVNLANEVQSISTGRLDKNFARLFPVTRNVEADLVADVDWLCDGMIDGITCDPSGQLMMLDPFYDVINIERGRLRHEIADWMQAVVDDLDDIKDKATLDVEEAYMAQAMRPVYERIRVIKGGKGQKAPRCGFPKQRHITFKAEVTKPGHLWTVICAAAERDLEELHQKHKGLLIDLVRSAFETIRSAYDDIKTTESDDAEEKHQKIVLTNCLREAEECMQGEMKVAYDALKEAFPTP